jgi:hypothetical protein
MNELLDKLNPSQVVAVICSVAGAAALVVFILAVLYYQLRALADDTALKQSWQQADLALRQELVRRNLPPAELKLALEALGADAPAAATSSGRVPSDDETMAKLLKHLVYCSEDVDGEVVEETVALVAAADRSVQRCVADALEDLVTDGYSGEAVFATVRAMCKAGAKKAVEPAKAEPAAGKPPIDLQFDRAVN